MRWKHSVPFSYNKLVRIWRESMTCEEMIYSNDYSDYLINFFDGMEGAEELYRNGCVNPIIERIAVLHMPRQGDYMTNLERVPYSFVPKLFGLMDSSNLETIGVKRVKNSEVLGVDGKNVIVGVVDTGAIVKIVLG